MISSLSLEHRDKRRKTKGSIRGKEKEKRRVQTALEKNMLTDATGLNASSATRHIGRHSLPSDRRPYISNPPVTISQSTDINSGGQVSSR